MTLSEELTWRGSVSQSTFDNLAELDKRTFTLYFGTDPTADSLTIGNLAAVMMVRRFLDHGHKIILLVGGATGMIGDPGGKSEERNLLDLKQIERNKNAQAEQLRKLFGGKDFTLVDNYDWLKNVNLLEFLRDTGKHFGMSTLVQREFIANRIGQGGSGISYTEFSYTLLQGYDFWHLHKNYGVDLQVGASDQWGNIISGVDLIRRKEQKEVHAFSCPLVVDRVTGKKFGKSEGNAIWLDPNKTSVFDFYQFWINTDDAGAIDYLKFYTLLGKAEIDQIAADAKENPASRATQKALAYEVTKLVHGAEQADAAKKASEALFGGKKGDNELTPTVEIREGEHDATELLVKAGLAASKSAARRLIEQGGFRVNDKKVEDEKVSVKKGDLLQLGKRRVVKLT